MPPFPKSPFYRVAIKALIFDAEHKLLVLENYHGEWELPGGGWEHDEEFLTCIEREIYEELSVTVESVGEIAFVYRGYNSRRNFMALRLAVPVTLQSSEINAGDDMKGCRFVDQQTFMGMDFTPAEGDIHKYADQIWHL